MENDPKSFEAAAQLFHKLQCYKGEMPIEFLLPHSALLLLDENKMRCHIFNCLTALHLIQIQKMKCVDFEEIRDHELVKRKVFMNAISMIIDDGSNSNHESLDTVLSAFPDESKMNDERSWLPMHFAIALIGEDKISEDDIYTLLSADPLSMHRLSNKVVDEEEEDDDQDEEEFLAGCTPAHILCSQKQPKMSLLMNICLRDPEAFVLCDQSGRCALHLAAQYSESLEMLQFILQIDRNMTKARDTIDEVTPLGLLCRRCQFPTFHKMVACLIEIDSSVEVISNGILECFRSYSEWLEQDITTGSEGENSLFLLGNLLNVNPAVTNYDDSGIFHEACYSLRGELGVSVLILLLAKDSTAVKTVRNGCLPVHQAANHSELDVLKYLIKAYPESISMLEDDGGNLLHEVVRDRFSDVSDVKAKIQFLCEQCPALMHMKDENGFTPLHDLLADEDADADAAYECAKLLCDIDETVVREKCTPSDTTLDYSGQLPLQRFLSIYKYDQISDVSYQAECVRLLLRLYPEGAGIKDDHSVSAYDIAISNDICSIQLQRWMLSADPTIDPVRRRNLNFEARREGMFLAFRALSSDVKPTIWAKIRFRDKDLLKRVITYL
jgi:ankyrin repeat protein